MPTIVAVDTGGTFTDFVVFRAGRLNVHKRASTPDDPARAVLEGVAAVRRPGESIVLAHGSTIATNALLERRGARTALITNRGFEDLIEIGRQNRPQLYALVGHRPPPLVAPEDRIGLCGRIGPDGTEEEPLDPAELVGLERRLRGIESVAVGLLHSYTSTVHEDSIAEKLAGLGIPVTASARLLREYREFERFSTAVVNAYIAPLVRRYLDRLDRESGAQRIRVMGSGGGALSVERAARAPVRTVLSGPAGGVVAALETARRLGFDRALSFDMGGTSTDVSLCPGRPIRTTEYRIADSPIAIPVIDIHTVGAGGGSIASLDPGRALKVGPESAGAVPGPICYALGGREITVTDAHVWLGRMPPDAFLGGARRLDRDLVAGPLAGLAAELGVSSEDAASGVLEVANTRMEGALRLISVERGHDPADLVMVAFGGAAPLHAAELAARLGVARVIVPPDPGTLSARGILVADVRKDASRTVLRREDEADFESLAPILAELESRAVSAIVAEGFDAQTLAIEREIDARYVGQSYELRVAADAAWIDSFHEAHRRRFGFARRDAELEAVTLRVTVSAQVAGPEPVRLAPAKRPPKAKTRAPVYLDGDWSEVALYVRESLAAGHRLQGPAVVPEYTATTWLPPGWQLEVAGSGDLILQKANGRTMSSKRPHPGS